MNYSEAIEYIHSFLKFGSKPGLERVSALLEIFSNPQNSLKTVHVAGTNGKGSTCEMISKALTSWGKKTGLFTSPYVSDFCERMQIDGKMISHGELSTLVEKFRDEISILNEKGIFPTEFELITAMAFDWFKKEKCDYAVMEVGLGGLYDSTNVIESPEVSVITHIDFDHEAVLGSTIKEITLQKCGIIKDGCPCVLYPEQYPEVVDIVKEECKKHNGKLIIPDVSSIEIIRDNAFGAKFSYKGKTYCLNMAGKHQIFNAITAVEALETIGCERIKEGIENAALPARIEVVNRDPLIILDGAHNPDGARALCDSLEKIGKYTAVLSIMSDKDVEGCLKYLLENAENAVVTKCDNPRSMQTDELALLCKKYCDNVFVCEKPEDAVKYALDNSKNIPVVVCGSLYLASEIRQFLKNISSQYK